MAGLRGNQAYIAVAKQSAKGAAVAGGAATFKNPFTGGNIGPTRATDRLSETDSARDQGAAYVASSSIEGSPELYVRPDSIGIYLGGALGGIAAPTGTTPNFTHVFTPAATLPYYTFWKMLGGSLYEKFTDCKIGSLTIGAEAGAPLTATAGIIGVNGTRLDATADAAAITALGGVAMDQEPAFSFNDAAVSLNDNAGALTVVKTVRAFEMTIENNLTAQQTDDVTMYDVAEGMREITLGFDLIFENFDEYAKFHYGSATGTAISPNIFTTAARFVFTKDANTELTLDFPSLAYEEFPVEPDAGGDPIVVSVRAVAQRASGVSNLVTATLKNNVTTYV